MIKSASRHIFPSYTDSFCSLFQFSSFFPYFFISHIVITMRLYCSKNEWSLNPFKWVMALIAQRIKVSLHEAVLVFVLE